MSADKHADSGALSGLPGRRCAAGIWGKPRRAPRSVSGSFLAGDEVICQVGQRAFDLLICEGVKPV